MLVVILRMSVCELVIYAGVYLAQFPQDNRCTLTLPHLTSLYNILAYNTRLQCKSIHFIILRCFIKLTKNRVKLIWSKDGLRA